MLIYNRSNSLYNIDWYNPINWNNPLNNGLILRLIYSPLMRHSNSWYDLCKKNNGILTNGPKWRGALGRIGGLGSLEFDGVDDYTTMGDVTAVNGIEKMTVAAWIRPGASLVALKSVISKFSTISQNGWIIETGTAGVGDSDDVICAVTTGTGGSDFGYTTGNILAVNTPGLWMMTFDGSRAGTEKLKFYFNGLQQTLTYSGTLPTTIPNTTNELRLGATSDGARFWSGVIDDICIWIGHAFTINEALLWYIETRSGSQLTLNRIKNYYFIPNQQQVITTFFKSIFSSNIHRQNSHIGYFQPDER